MDCGGKRSATPLFGRWQTLDFMGKTELATEQLE
jgi:hypothetical protein